MPVSASHCLLVLFLPLLCMRSLADCGIGMNGAHATAASVPKDRCFALELMLLSLCSSATPFFLSLFSLSSFLFHTRTLVACFTWLVGSFIWLAVSLSSSSHTHTCSLFFSFFGRVYSSSCCLHWRALCTHTHTHTHTHRDGWLENTLAHKQLIIMMVMA